MRTQAGLHDETPWLATRGVDVCDVVAFCSPRVDTTSQANYFGDTNTHLELYMCHYSFPSQRFWPKLKKHRRL